MSQEIKNLYQYCKELQIELRLRFHPAWTNSDAQEILVSFRNIDKIVNDIYMFYRCYAGKLKPYADQINNIVAAYNVYAQKSQENVQLTLEVQEIIIKNFTIILNSAEHIIDAIENNCAIDKIVYDSEQIDDEVLDSKSQSLIKKIKEIINNLQDYVDKNFEDSFRTTSVKQARLSIDKFKAMEECINLIKKDINIIEKEYQREYSNITHALGWN